jgi:putative SOS response-associated peptidase YedK
MPIQIVYGDRHFGDPRLGEARWGFVPGWWKQPKPPTHCFNARSEDAATKPMWKYSLQRARCLVPAEGCYEWTEGERTDARTGEVRTYRQPYYIHRGDGRLMAFAGLMSFWHPDPESMVLTCAIVTKPAAKSIAGLHDRMPAVLEESDFARWLDPNLHDAEAVEAMIAGAQSDFESYAVSTRLNAAKEDDERLVEPVAI